MERIIVHWPFCNYCDNLVSIYGVHSYAITVQPHHGCAKESLNSCDIWGNYQINLGKMLFYKSNYIFLLAYKQWSNQKILSVGSLNITNLTLIVVSNYQFKKSRNV